MGCGSLSDVFMGIVAWLEGMEGKECVGSDV